VPSGVVDRGQCPRVSRDRIWVPHAEPGHIPTDLRAVRVAADVLWPTRPSLLKPTASRPSHPPSEANTDGCEKGHRNRRRIRGVGACRGGLASGSGIRSTKYDRRVGGNDPWRHAAGAGQSIRRHDGAGDGGRINRGRPTRRSLLRGLRQRVQDGYRCRWHVLPGSSTGVVRNQWLERSIRWAVRPARVRGHGWRPHPRRVESLHRGRGRVPHESPHAVDTRRPRRVGAVPILGLRANPF
jgi:hypothetical protein